MQKLQKLTKRSIANLFKECKKRNNNTAVKYVRNFRKIIKICLDNDWLDKDSTTRYERKMKEVERITLLLKIGPSLKEIYGSV